MYLNLVIWDSPMRHELLKFDDNTPIYVMHNLWQLLCPYVSILFCLDSEVFMYGTW